MTSTVSPTGSASESSQPGLATPFISIKELRKILGKDAENLDDDYIRKVSITLGEMALTLTTNPELFANLTNPKEESSNE